MDIKHAFRLIPAHHDYWSNFCMVWRDKYFVDKVLPFPVATGEDKVVGPTTVMTVLGIEVDGVAQESRLPADKLVYLLSLLKECQGRSSASKPDILSLVGHISFAAKVVPTGRTFIRWPLESANQGAFRTMYDSSIIRK